MGGLWVPNLAAYNMAAILELASVFWDAKTSHRWSEIEESSWPSWGTRDVLTSIALELKPPTNGLLSMTHLCDLWHHCDH